MNLYWYSLIKLSKSRGLITTGLTIPYIFGAYKILGLPFNDIAQLVFAILESKADKFPVIQKCPVIGQHVVMLEEKVNCNKYYKKEGNNITCTGVKYLINGNWKKLERLSLCKNQLIIGDNKIGV